MERLPEWEIALRRLDMPPARFFAFYVSSAAVLGFLTGLVMMFTGLFTGFSGIILVLFLRLNIYN